MKETTMKNIKIASLVSCVSIALTSLSGCSQKTIEIKANDTPGLANPSLRIQVKRNTPALKGATFGWGVQIYKIPKKFSGSIAAISKRLTSSLQTQLIAKGMRFTDNNPDYLISFGVGTAGEINENEINEAYLDLIGNKLSEEPSELYYKQGVMIVDVVENASKKLVWRGAIMAEINTEWPEERKQERCDTAIHELLKCYPRP